MSRSRTVMLLVMLGAIILILSLFPWIHTDAATVLGPQPVTLSGASALPLVPGAALVVMAAGLAVGLSGPVVRYLAVGAAALACAGALVLLIVLLGDATGPAESAAERLGGVRELVRTPEFTVWPWVTLVALAVTVLLAVVLPFRMGTWAPVARKYETTPRQEQFSPRADWDALSAGVDPTEEDTGADTVGR